MPYRMLLAAAAAAVAATKGVAQAPAAAPDRHVRILATTDSELVSIAVAAAKVIDEATPTPKSFSGAFVGSREARAATDRVIAATRWHKFDGRVPYVVCRQGTPCPEAEEARARVVWRMVSFRVTDDSAYVGAEGTSAAQGPRSHCVTLLRAGNAWSAGTLTTIESARRCGQ
jgi:hypothetical protein